MRIDQYMVMSDSDVNTSAESFSARFQHHQAQRAKLQCHNLHVQQQIISPRLVNEHTLSSFAVASKPAEVSDERRRIDQILSEVKVSVTKEQADNHSEEFIRNLKRTSQELYDGVSVADDETNDDDDAHIFDDEDDDEAWLSRINSSPVVSMKNHTMDSAAPVAADGDIDISASADNNSQDLDESDIFNSSDIFQQIITARISKHLENHYSRAGAATETVPTSSRTAGLSVDELLFDDGSEASDISDNQDNDSLEAYSDA